jgi:hypothetical protein
MTVEKILAGTLRGDMKSRCGELILREGCWEEAVALSCGDNPKTAWRAAWGVEWAWFAASSHPALPPCGFPASLSQAFARSDNGGVQRIYGKIIADMLSRGLEFTAAQLEAIVSKSFDLLIDPSARPAVKVWCFEILFLLRGHASWIADALTETLRNILSSPESSAGLVSRAKKTLKMI